MAPHKVPKEVHFLEALPKNLSGKLLKRDLRLAYGGAQSAVGSV